MNSKIPEKVVLKISKIYKNFPVVKVLDNFDFELRQGRCMFCSVSENSAGKSTLVKIISGAIPPSEGKIFLLDNEVVSKSPKHAQNLGIGTIYQELNLIPLHSASENIFLSHKSKNIFSLIKNKNLLISTKKILEDLGLEIDSKTPVKNFGIAQYPEEMDKLAVEYAFKAINGESFPAEIPVKIDLITKKTFQKAGK